MFALEMYPTALKGMELSLKSRVPAFEIEASPLLPAHNSGHPGIACIFFKKLLNLWRRTDPSMKVTAIRRP